MVSESVPHLKRGAIRDFKNILKDHKYWKDANWNVQDSTYSFETGSQIEFFSADNGDKLRGSRRDRLFINEANNVTFEAFEQLEVRTREFVYLDWNPSNEFWYYTDVKGKRDDIEEVTLTYKDNEALEPEIIKSLETRKNRKNWWLVYGLGQLGEIEGKIYKDWQIITEIPHEAELIRTGMDFGYYADPSTAVDIYKYNGGYIWDEVFYERELVENKRIAEILKSKPRKALVKADRTQSRSIDEIASYGVMIVPSAGGSGSVEAGIAFIQGQRISITQKSVNIIKEYRNYLWKVDKDGKVINVPEHSYSHTMDAGRYGMEDLYLETEETEQDRAERSQKRMRSQTNYAR